MRNGPPQRRPPRLEGMKLCLVVGLWLGCGGGRPVHPSITENEPLALPTEWVACRADADCQALELGCCDHCNGGWVMAVNQAHVARALAAYHANCESHDEILPDGTMTFSGPSCTEVGCGPIGERCAGGRCVWTWDARLDDVFWDQPNVVLPERIRGCAR